MTFRGSSSPDFDVMSTTAASLPPYSAGMPPVMTSADLT